MTGVLFQILQISGLNLVVFQKMIVKMRDILEKIALVFVDQEQKALNVKMQSMIIMVSKLKKPQDRSLANFRNLNVNFNANKNPY